jgi:hypothetical protein
MLNFTATAKSGSQAAEANAAWADVRPLADLGAGAFASEGAWVGSGASKRVASRALPRIRRAFAPASSPVGAQAHGRGCGAYQPGMIGGNSVGTSTSTTSLMTLVNPVIPGGLGPHPAREPEPV